MAAIRIMTNYLSRHLFYYHRICLAPTLIHTNFRPRGLLGLTVVHKPHASNSISTSAWLHKDKPKEKVKIQKVDDKELGEYVDVKNLRSALQSEVEKLTQYFIRQLSTRSSVSLVETLPIQFEGENYELQDLAQIAKKGKNILALNMAGFPQTTATVMKALRASSLGLNPSQDGTLITVQLPRVTKEHRENLAKQAKQAFVDCKKAIDRIIVAYNKEANQENLSKDEGHRVLALLRLVAAQYLQEAEKALKTKQDELKLEE